MPSPAFAFAAHRTGPPPAGPVPAAGLPLWPPQVRGAGWRAGEGRGTVHATTTVRDAGEPARDLSLVDLDGGPRLITRIVGVAPETVAVGMRVQLAWDGEIPVFAPET